MKYPVTKTQPTSATFGRVSYSDSYQWLEEETPDVQEWESAQNQLTRTWFDSSPAKACADRLMAAMPRIESNEFPVRSEEHTSELQSLMRISYAVFCLTK